MTSSDFKPRFQCRDITQRQTTRKRYKIELHVYLLWLSASKSYVIYRIKPFSMTLNDP